MTISTRWVDALLETHPQCADFYCPLTHVIMFDPVIAEDGMTYERGAIERYLEVHGTSPIVRARQGDGFIPIGPQLKPNPQRKAALDRILRDYNHEDEPELIEWDRQGLQQYLPDARSVALESPTSLVPPPAQPRAVADMTQDLSTMFKILDPLRAELNTLVNLTPPKIVVIGDESSGKSTVLEQLIRMPLFPRKKTFCTRLPIHVRLRRPDATREEQASVTMSVITAQAYAKSGYDAEPDEFPRTIATASGYHHVQDCMDELSSRLTGETGGIVSDRIIVLDVLHPEVPVIDLIDLPGIVAVDVPGVTPPGKVAAVERVISQQIEADRKHGMTSFYLVVVPCERPNTSNTFKLIQREGLLDRAIGVSVLCATHEMICRATRAFMSDALACPLPLRPCARCSRSRTRSRTRDTSSRGSRGKTSRMTMTEPSPPLRSWGRCLWPRAGPRRCSRCPNAPSRPRADARSTTTRRTRPSGSRSKRRPRSASLAGRMPRT